MNEEMARRELINVGERTQAPRWPKQRRANMLRSEGQRLLKCNCVSCFPFLGKHHDSGALSTPTPSSASWSADKLSRAKAEWTDLLDNSIRIELSAMLRGHQPYSSGPLSQISGWHFIRPKLIGQRLTRTRLKGPIKIDGKSEHMRYGLLLWQSIYGSSKKLGWQFYQQTLCKFTTLKGGCQC